MNQISKRLVFCGAASLLGVFLPTVHLNADTLVLQSGNEISGRFISVPSEEDTVYHFRAVDGIEFSIRKSEVKSVERSKRNGAVEEYEKLKEETPDTVEGHLALAEWCAEKGQAGWRKAHLERVLELDTDNAEARRALGYSKRLDGEWRTTSEEMKDQGKVRYKGNWVSQQEKELFEKRDREKVQIKKLESSIRKSLKKLQTASRDEGLAELESLRDPLAVPGIQKIYAKERRPYAKKVLIKCLGRINTDAAKGLLQVIVVEDFDEEARLSALDNLKAEANSGMTKYFISRLSPKTSTHEQINRAAYALGELGDRSAIPALIYALETTHKFQVTTGNQNGQTTAGFGQNSMGGGGGGFSVGSSTQTVSQTLRNPEVLEALKRLSNANFYYDKNSWISWYQAQIGGGNSTLRP